MRIKVRTVEDVISLTDALKKCSKGITINGIPKEKIFEKIPFNTILEVEGKPKDIALLDSEIPHLIIENYTAKITLPALDICDAMTIANEIKQNYGIDIEYLVKTRERRMLEIV